MHYLRGLESVNWAPDLLPSCNKIGASHALSEQDSVGLVIPWFLTDLRKKSPIMHYLKELESANWAPDFKNWIGQLIIYTFISDSMGQFAPPTWPKKNESVSLLFGVIPDSRGRFGPPTWPKK